MEFISREAHLDLLNASRGMRSDILCSEGAFRYWL